MPIPAQFNEEDAFHFIIRYLRGRREARYDYGGTYGYDVYLPNVMRQYVILEGGIDEHHAGGRIKIENLIIGKQTGNVQDEFRSQAGLLKYWRDTAAHGRRAGITDNEAYTSLALLLRFAQFVNDRWENLTTSQTETHE